MESYQPPWWARGGHWQTLLAASTAVCKQVRYRRERWLADDGEDFVDVDWAGPEHAPRLLVAFHGLEGSSAAHYTRALAWHALQSGCWRIAAPHFRGCSGEPNRKARSYFSGDADEVDWMLERFLARNNREPFFAFGVSLGANCLLKWLCREGGAAARVVSRAAALSAQFDLKASGTVLGQGFNRVYGWYFLYLTCLRRKAVAKFKRFRSELVARGAHEHLVRAATTFSEFDNTFVAPANGLGDASSYWAQRSTEAELSNIRVRTLLLNARNDPFYPDELLQGLAESEWITQDFQASGGHASFPGRRQWMARRVLEFLSEA